MKKKQVDDDMQTWTVQIGVDIVCPHYSMLPVRANSRSKEERQKRKWEMNEKKIREGNGMRLEIPARRIC